MAFACLNLGASWPGKMTVRKRCGLAVYNHLFYPNKQNGTGLFLHYSWLEFTITRKVKTNSIIDRVQQVGSCG